MINMEYNIDKYGQMLFDRCFQSYIMGGDKYCFNFPTEKPNITERYQNALKELEENGLIEIHFLSEKRVRFSLTDKGVEYGNKQI